MEVSLENNLTEYSALNTVYIVDSSRIESPLTWIDAGCERPCSTLL
jgi:hypothetical protein